MPKKKRKPVHFDLWGNPIVEDPSPRCGAITPYDFEGEKVDFTSRRGGVLINAADCCEIADIKNVSQALTRLDDDEKVLISNDTLGGRQKAWFVTEPGFYSLILSARLRRTSPHFSKVKRFRRWVTHEVLPQIRKTGSYSVKPKTRVAREAIRLNCNEATAKVRCDQFAMNLNENRRLASEGSTPYDHRKYHNSGYRGGCQGMEAKDLRKQMGMKRGTPLDRMDAVPLTINLCAKAVVERVARQAREDGKPMPLVDQANLLESVARELTEVELRRFGPKATLGFTDDPRRGLILDVVQRQISA